VAAAIQGIREIVNIIQVDRPTEPLVYDPLVDDGFVILTGTVESALAFEAAMENAFEGGAVWVDNRLDID